jgi:hypothetical protein
MGKTDADAPRLSCGAAWFLAARSASSWGCAGRLISEQLLQLASLGPLYWVGRRIGGVIQLGNGSAEIYGGSRKPTHDMPMRELQMVAPSPFTSELIFRFEQSTGDLLVIHPNVTDWPQPIARITAATLDGMAWPEASRFIGEFVTLLMPDLRKRFEAEFVDAKGRHT